MTLLLLLILINMVLLSLVLFLILKNRKTRLVLINNYKIQEQDYEERNHFFSQEIAELNKRLEFSELLAIVTRQTENAVMLMDAQGNITWVNDSFVRMYEYTYDEFIHALGDNIRKTSFNPKIVERLNRCVKTKEAVTYEALNVTKTGKSLWTHTSLIPLVNSHNEVIGLVTVDSDVHKRISASEALVEHTMSIHSKIEKIAEQLEVMVELTNVLFERIDKSQRRIERTNQIITFVKGISDQTKILGINASIEAHTAGVHGKGFRVVANEMVAISALTINALKEINDLIGSVKRSSDKMGNEKERSEEAISLHRSFMEELKKEIKEVENVLYKLNKQAS